ncbi:splicing factor U2AF-associated protein [Striga asiatica]|uniref:Splicing factor U2AF-associated protein n=1 Tax=Striga asiatica TaxID=4170 RepID=A0A5A7R1R4_STRAF|nr:splicing factor U2AF-associated protein [Striga asiatica]
MFYSQFILAKKGPLGTIWIAAHLERKLRKNQVADTDIGVSVDSILFPDVPIALRLSSHLLLGVVRIYNKKVNYLFDDCSEALLKVKQAFRSTAVDLPPEESKAPYHSITLPEKFDLDDFELPDTDITQGNYVDHHISSREQITLQDTMEGVSYSTSKFGLDERFGDGDASGLDLDEELFMNKIGAAGDANESADPQASYQPTSPLKHDEHRIDRATNSDIMVDDADEPDDLMDYAQAPCTPRLVEEPNLSNAKGASACDDHLETEYHLMESTVRENEDNVPYKDKQEADWCSREDKISDAVPLGQHEENGPISSRLEINESNSQRESHLEGHDEDIRPISEFTDGMEVANGQLLENLQTEAVQEVNKTGNNYQGPGEVDTEINAGETFELASSDQQVVEGVPLKDLASPAVDVSNCVGKAINQQESCDDGPGLAPKNQVESFLEAPETRACQQTENSVNIETRDKEVSSVTILSGQYNSVVENPDVTKPGDSISTDAGAKSNAPSFVICEGENTMESGQEYGINSNPEHSQKENQVPELASGEDTLVIVEEADAQVHNANSQYRSVEDLKNSAEHEFSAPEKLLSVPEGHVDSHIDMPVEINTSEFVGFDGGDAGSKSAAGRKRSFTESTLTEQSLNSAESSRQVRARTAGSVPDYDDLLSSILVGRKSSALKVKPTPPLTEVTSMKRGRSVLRSRAPKRKVLMDDTMVLHGEYVLPFADNIIIFFLLFIYVLFLVLTFSNFLVHCFGLKLFACWSMFEKQLEFMLSLLPDSTIRLQLTNTEDIRRARKKAPCTLSEISVIQKQHMEDEFFVETVFSGMTAELTSLHSQICDLSRIRVCKDDPNGPSLETLAEARLPSQDDTILATPESTFGPNLASLDDNKSDVPLETVARVHLTSSNNGNYDEAPEGDNVIETSEQGVNNQILIAKENEPTSLREILPQNEIILEGVNDTKGDDSLSQEPTKPTDDVRTDASVDEVLVNAADLGAGPTDAVSDNLSIPEVKELDFTRHAKDDVDQTGCLDESGKRNSHVNVDALDVVPSAELDCADIYDEQGIAREEMAKKDDDVNVELVMEVGEKDDIFLDMNEDAAVEKGADVNYRELEHNLETEFYNEEQRELEFSHQVLEGMLDDGFINASENPNHSEAYQPNVMDAETCGFDMNYPGFSFFVMQDIFYASAGNDTAFLNVDDDELTEIADDHMPDDEEAQYTENSGWSSRTRAVSKYLQSAFVKEAESGRKSLSMDKLLIGKSRKEASRMFFETLAIDSSSICRRAKGQKRTRNYQKIPGTMSSQPQISETSTRVGWYILGLDQQLIGPYTTSELQEHYSSGYLTQNTLVWSEGCSDWQPLFSVPGLSINAPQEIAPDLVPDTSKEEDEFKKWQREVSEAEAEAEAEVSVNVENERPTTPPEGEEEFTDDDGTTYKWDRTLKAWVPQEDIPPKDEYAPEDMTFVQEEEVFPTMNTDELTVKKEVKDAVEADEKKPNSKRKSPDNTDDKKGADKKEANKPPDSWFELKVNTHVYVTGLPEDVTTEEIVEVFSKCGIIKEQASVPLAIQILDGAPLRSDGKIPMTVSEAKFEQKGDKFVSKQVDKNKKRKHQKVEQKMLGWGGRDDAKVSIPATVILRYMFTPAELRADENLRSELEEDVRDECGKLGPLDSVKVCENNPQGVVLVKYKDSKDAHKCIELMNGRWFGGKQIQASIDDGSVNHALIRDLEEETDRLEKFGAELEAD